MQGHMGVTHGDRVTKQGLWKAGFVISRGCGALLFPQEDVIGLSE